MLALYCVVSAHCIVNIFIYSGAVLDENIFVGGIAKTPPV